MERHVANELGRALDDGTGIPAGDAAASADEFIRWARDMGLPLDNRTAQKWALDVAAGRETGDGVKAKITALAKGRWLNDPEVLAHITSGGTAADYFAIHRNTIADILELSPDSIDLFNDPRYASVLQMYDSKTEKKRSMTLGEVAQWARDRPEFSNTRRYKQEDAQFTTGLLNTFGAIA